MHIHLNFFQSLPFEKKTTFLLNFLCYPLSLFSQPLRTVICMLYFHILAYSFYLTQYTNSTVMSVIVVTIDLHVTKSNSYFRTQLTETSDIMDHSLLFITSSSTFQTFTTCFIQSPSFLPIVLHTFSVPCLAYCFFFLGGGLKILLIYFFQVCAEPQSGSCLHLSSIYC